MFIICIFDLLLDNWQVDEWLALDPCSCIGPLLLSQKTNHDCNHPGPLTPSVKEELIIIPLAYY